MSFSGTEAALWYNVGDFAQLGLAVPNCDGYTVSQNNGILKFVDVVGRNLAAIMFHTDSKLRTPPSINSIRRIRKLCERITTLLDAEAIPPGTPNMETVHGDPSPADFIIYPAPYFLVRNTWLKEYAGYVLMMLTDAIQHTENRKPIEISTTFASQMSPYIKRIYQRIAIELLLVDKATAQADGFQITEAHLTAYDPTKVVTSTEMIDTVSDLQQAPTDNELFPVTAGIAAGMLPKLPRWPRAGVPLYPTESPQRNGTMTGNDGSALSDSDGSADPTKPVAAAGGVSPNSLPNPSI